MASAHEPGSKKRAGCAKLHPILLTILLTTSAAVCTTVGFAGECLRAARLPRVAICFVFAFNYNDRRRAEVYTVRHIVLL